MLPVATITAPVPAPATLIATALPDSNALRVPADTVAPTVSSVSVDLNASGNSAPQPIISAQTPAPAAIASNDNAPLFAGALDAGSSPAAQAAFIAQLVSQEIPPAQRSAYSGVLEQYEKIVANSFVKYKPSNAGIPQFTPEHAFQQTLHEESAPVRFEAPQPPPQAAPEPQPQAEPAPVQQTAPVVNRSPLRTSRAPQPDLSGTTKLDITPTPAPAASSAYAASSALNAAKPKA